MKKQQYAVIGIGRFGESLIRELVRMGHEVLAIDTDEDRIQDMADIATQAVQADSMDEKVLKALDITSFDAVIVAIGGDIEASILTCLTLKEMGVKKTIAKAQNGMHGKVLSKIGVDLVVHPERDMAIRLARTLVSNSIIEHIDLSADYGIWEIVTPRSLVGKNLKDSGLRPKLGLNILAIKTGDDIVVSPLPEHVIHAGDILVVLGPTRSLEKLNGMD
ncbi:MAG TPA: TrkA family potassium uptake protein [Syntrophomonadaceae bacterium]|nr:TrkA family potassium uptake protein [Syntrophomonadaceae bacterium]HQA06793.1 TrkA family potassium uptake protein [Syntrophomonadaceae bacterium]HQE22874.1 TrkA family potassium uptake protein [Syntrophomonadaceae bacterium]